LSFSLIAKPDPAIVSFRLQLFEIADIVEAVCILDGLKNLFDVRENLPVPGFFLRSFAKLF
jgi:hypothetical protein